MLLNLRSRTPQRAPLPAPAPLDFSEVGSCVDIWWVGEGSKGCFYLIFIIFFWLAPLASIIHSVNIWKIRITCKFKMVIRSPVMHTIAGFHASAISMFILSQTHDFTPFKPKKFWERTSPLWHKLHIFQFYKA